MCLPTDKYPILRILEDHWWDILGEYQRIVNDRARHAWPETGICEGRWDTYALYAFGKKRQKNCEQCPMTTWLVEQIPGMVTAGFSRLAPGTRIKPHVGCEGRAQYVLRCHLGLVVNDRCEMRVGTETRKWQRGKVAISCDATEHEVWNRGNTERVILLVDFRNPDFRWHFLNPQITPEMQDFFRQQWPELTWSEKLSFYCWRMANWWRKPRTYVEEIPPKSGVPEMSSSSETLTL
jgi:beta-hydroxylase